MHTHILIPRPKAMVIGIACLPTFWHAIPTSFYILSIFLFVLFTGYPFPNSPHHTFCLVARVRHRSNSTISYNVLFIHRCCCCIINIMLTYYSYAFMLQLFQLWVGIYRITQKGFHFQVFSSESRQMTLCVLLISHARPTS